MKTCGLLLLLLVYGSTLAQIGSQAKIDSVISKLPLTKEDSNRVKVLNEVSFSYYPINPDEGIRYGYKALALALKINWKLGIASSYRSIGVNFGFGKSDFNRSFEFYNKALILFQELNNLSGIGKVYGHLGAAYYEQSDYPIAIDYYYKALKIFEEQGDKSKVANLYGNIGIVYNDQKDYQLALDYDYKSLNLYEELGDKGGIAKMLGNIGNVYANSKNYDKSLEYDFRALKLKKELGLTNGVALVTGNIGDVYMHQGNFPKAFEFFFQALGQFKILGDKKSIAINFGNIGETHLLIAKESLKGNSSSKMSNETQQALLYAKRYIDSSILINKQINYLKGLAEKYRQVSEINELLGNNPEALENYKQFSGLKDSLFNIDKNNRITQITLRHDYEKKEAERISQEEKARLDKVRTERIHLTGVGVFIILLIGVILYLSRKQISVQFIKILTVFSVLLVFEFFTLLLHKRIEIITHHNLILTFICLVAVAAVIIPIHHKVEKWFIIKLSGRAKFKGTKTLDPQIPPENSLNGEAEGLLAIDKIESRFEENPSGAIPSLKEKE